MENLKRKQDAGFTWRFMAEKTGIHPASLSQKLHGTAGWTLNDMVEVSAFLDCPIDRLVIK